MKIKLYKEIGSDSIALSNSYQAKESYIGIVKATLALGCPSPQRHFIYIAFAIPKPSILNKRYE